ncbi:hypothetical protein VARIO8X_130160 [Burkholderiales bacterium 8X]|nr:hypothetical protein VARIO8X_130160 [Burkholderiales bacterium 8X]
MITGEVNRTRTTGDLADAKFQKADSRLGQEAARTLRNACVLFAPPVPVSAMKLPCSS